MGIEPTWDFVEPHAGFEDQERHQVAPHLRAGWIRRLPGADAKWFQRAESPCYLVRFDGPVQLQSERRKRPFYTTAKGKKQEREMKMEIQSAFLPLPELVCK